MSYPVQVAEAWKPTAPVYTCGSLCRSPEHYRKILEQFEVATNQRYLPRLGATFCNIFVWDVTRAMACEIPHWNYGNELNANQLAEWLRTNGRDFGWKKVDQLAAQVSASFGHPTVAVWPNPSPSGPGHIAMVMPVADELLIAQAGATNFMGKPLAAGFGKLPVALWTHD